MAASLVGDPARLRRSTSRVGSALLLLVVLATLGRIAYITTCSEPNLVYRTTDDAYYYFNVARHIVDGHGPSFDGTNLTNGFHPLWMLAILPVYAVSGGDPVFGLRAALILAAVLAGVTLWAAYSCVAHYAGRTAALAATVAMLAPPGLNAMLNGLETGLLLLLLFTLMNACERYDLTAPRASTGRNALLAVLLSGVFLCRLDSAFLILGVLMLMVVRAVREPGRQAWLRALIVKYAQVGLASAVLCLPYFIWNFATFGHLMPISGALKSTFPRISFEFGRLFSGQTLFGLAQLIFCAAVLLFIAAGRHAAAVADTKQAEQRAKLALPIALWVGCVLHFVYAVLFMHWAAHWWHYASYLPVTLVLGGVAFDRVYRMVGRSALAGVVGIGGVMIACAAGLYLDAQRRGLHHQPWYEAAVWARKNLPDDAVLAMTDCGIVGYFSGWPTVNLDGVINGYEYQEALRSGRLTQYLKGCGVTHIADYEVRYHDDRYIIRLPARLAKTPGGAIIATPAAEVYRSAPYTHAFNRHGDIRFTIWGLDQLVVVNDARDIPSSKPPASP